MVIGLDCVCESWALIGISGGISRVTVLGIETGGIQFPSTGNDVVDCPWSASHLSGDDKEII